MRAALIGCGRIGAFTDARLRRRLGSNWLPLSHAEGIVACDGLDLVACCDVDRAAAERAAAHHGAPAAYDDLDSMLAAEAVDVLSVATRSDVRPAILHAAAAAGVRGVHSEKPLAGSVRAAEAIGAALTAARVAFSYGALRRWMPVFARMRDIAAEGAIGEVEAIGVRFGRGGLMWTHPHSVDILCFLAGDAPVAWVQATLAFESAQHRGDVVDCDPVVLAAAIGFETGVIGQIVPEAGLSVDIAGRDGGLSVVGDAAYLLHRDHALGRACRAPETWRFEADDARESGRVRALRAVRDGVRADAFDAAAIARVVDQHRVLLAMVQSHLEGGRRVAPSEVDPALTVTGRVDGHAA